jgi:hypothetical protein
VTKLWSWIKQVGVGLVAVATLVLVALLLAAFGNCKLAAFVADLAPKSEHWSKEDISRAVMKLCIRDCAPAVTAEVLRYCKDRVFGGFRYYEEAAIVYIRVDSHGLKVTQFSAVVVPGDVSGVDTPNLEVIDGVAGPLERIEKPSGANVGEWQITYHLQDGRAIAGAEPQIVPIRYYALTSRSNEQSLSCDSGKGDPTVSVSARSAPSVDLPDHYIQVTAKEVNWTTLLGEPGRRRFFSEKSETASLIVHQQAIALTAKNDQSGWRYWPNDFPAASR